MRWRNEEIYRFFSLSLKLPCTVEIAVSSHANYLQHFFLEWALRVTWVNLFWAKFPCFKRCLNSGTSDTMPCFMKDHVSEWRNTHIMTKAFSSLDTKNGLYQNLIRVETCNGPLCAGKQAFWIFNLLSTIFGTTRARGFQIWYLALKHSTNQFALNIRKLWTRVTRFNPYGSLVIPDQPWHVLGVIAI